MTSSSKAIAAREAVEAEGTRGSGLLGRFFRRMIAAREAKGRALAYQHLANFSDARLLDLGYEPAEIRRLRAYTATAPLYWE